MFRKRLFLIISALLATFLLAFLVLYSFFKSPNGNFLGNNSQPAATKTIPQAATPGLSVWSGSLNLSQPPSLIVNEKKYRLEIKGADAFSVLKKQNFQTGDTVNVMGKLNGAAIDLSGINKLAK